MRPKRFAGLLLFTSDGPVLEHQTTDQLTAIEPSLSGQLAPKVMGCSDIILPDTGQWGASLTGPFPRLSLHEFLAIYQQVDSAPMYFSKASSGENPGQINSLTM